LLPPACNGTEHRRQDCRTLRLFTPRLPPFDENRIKAFRRVAAGILPGTGLLVAAFHSPATASAFTDSIPGSKLPTCYFAANKSVQLPVRPFRSTTGSGSPRLRRFLCFRPVATSPTCSTGRVSCLHSPLGLLPPSGSQCSTRCAASRPAFRIRPIPFAPRSWFLSLVSATDHRSGSAMSSQAGRWSSQIPTRLHVSGGTRVSSAPHRPFTYRAVTVSGRPFHAVQLGRCCHAGAVSGP